MAPRTTDQIRQAYLDFFKEKGHAIIPGAPLVPENDPTVLFTTAGMHPLVPYLLGEPHSAGKRLTDVQRCVRTGDIDDVGDATHLTMFEMLGNWSLGDYFKKEAIEWSYEFLTSPQWLGLDVSRLAVSVFAGDADAPFDEEAFKIWQALGIPVARIAKLPKKNNWWGPAGQTGPCGPDTEIFYWTGDPKDTPTSFNDDHPLWVEIWNNVFMQYNKDEHSAFVPLKQQNVDTGMGLERISAVMQGVASVYDTDSLAPIFDLVLAASSVPEGKEGGFRAQHARIITDHLRASIFIIADGVMPSNVDQGYVLRRLIRRAVRSGMQIGIDGFTEFTKTFVAAVVRQYGSAYPLLTTKAQDITQALVREEEQFAATLKEGLKHLSKVMEKAQGTIDGQSAFHLYDTYGFPIELTKEMAAEQKLTVDEDGFKKAFEAHQALSRAGAEQKFKGGLADNGAETTKLHTATHLLNAALKKVLGPQIQQKGSNITAERLRFDFNYDGKMTPEQIAETERLVNEQIALDLPIAFHLTTVEGAKEEGAVGVFDDRYGSEVKVYAIGDGTFSKEICGGPHVSRTGLLGTFKIQKEESSSAGVRRIKAVVSGGPAEIETAGSR